MDFRIFENLVESLNYKKKELPKLELFLLYSGENKNNIISFKEEHFSNDDCIVGLRIKVITLTFKANIINEYIQFTKIFDKCVG